MDVLTTRYSENLTGVLSCYDRIVITGTLPGACFADGMTSFLYSRGIRIFDYPQFALPLRERIRENAQALATEHGATIEHIAKDDSTSHGLVHSPPRCSLFVSACARNRRSRSSC